MVLARVRFVGSVRDVVKGTRDEIELVEGATVGDLIRALVDKHGDALARRVLSPEGKLQSYTRVFVDGVEVEGNHVDRTPLADGEATVNVEIFVVQMTMGG
ncbi:MAG TPA: MoaD/ThiS family protein [Dehalococcoidia bacterium]|nr:MoaD/ThiS family protein [Dehalococcoidia bacterium]